MRPRSIYTVECICGQTIASEYTECVCPGCGRMTRLEWRPAPKPASAEPKTISERYER